MTKIKISWDFKVSVSSDTLSCYDNVLCLQHNQLGESVYSKLQMNISRLL